MVSDRDRQILDFGMRLERNRNLASVTFTRVGMSPVQFTQRLLHLVIQPEIVADPRYTMFCHRVHNAAAVRMKARAERQLVAKAS